VQHANASYPLDTLYALERWRDTCSAAAYLNNEVRTLMKWKVISGVLAVLLVGTNLWHLYRAADVAVTDMYREDELYRLANQLSTVSRICDLVVAGKTETEIVHLMKRHFPDSEPFVKEQGVHMTWLSVALDKSGKASSCVLDESVAAFAAPHGERAKQ